MIITNWKIMLLTSLHSNCYERYFIDNWIIKIGAIPVERFKAEIRQRNDARRNQARRAREKIGILGWQIVR